jgi:hypothetical protein
MELIYHRKAARGKVSKIAEESKNAELVNESKNLPLKPSKNTRAQKDQ